MFRPLICLSLFLVACGVAPQPESNRTVAAFEVPLPTAADKEEFLALLRQKAETHGFHVDAASSSELRQLSEVSPITFNATVWRGDDEEIVASAMDFQTHIGRVWISFAKGKEPKAFDRFREALMPQVRKRWPNTAALPIMPTGAIPLDGDLLRTQTGYVVKPSAKSNYLMPSQ